MQARLVLVADSSIWIDLGWGEILSQVFNLPFEYRSPDFVMRAELESTTPEKLISLGLILVPLSEDEMGELENMRKDFGRGLSIPDLASLHIAVRDEITLLTSDRALRITAEQQGVEVHGILWLFDHLVDSGSIAPQDAIERLNQIRNHNSYLPNEKCEARILRWQTL